MNKKKKSALITLAVAVVAVAGYLAYHYAYLIYQDYDYHSYYGDVHGLQRLSPVTLNGVRVGKVSSIKLQDREQAKVTMEVDKDVKIPVGTVALIASSDLTGSKMIILSPGDGPGNYTHNDIITGRYDTSVMEMKDQINPIIESTKYILNTADRNFSAFNRKVDNGLISETQANIRKMERDMGRFSRQAADIKENAADVLESVDQLARKTTDMASRNPETERSIKKAEANTKEIGEVPVQSYTKDIGNAAGEVRRSAEDLSNNNASFNNMLNDRSAYEDINRSAEEIKNDLREMKEEPTGISLIGN